MEGIERKIDLAAALFVRKKGTWVEIAQIKIACQLSATTARKKGTESQTAQRRRKWEQAASTASKKDTAHETAQNPRNLAFAITATLKDT